MFRRNTNYSESKMFDISAMLSGLCMFSYLHFGFLYT